MADLTRNPDDTITSRSNSFLTPEGIKSLLGSIGLVVGSDGKVTEIGKSTGTETGTSTGTETGTTKGTETGTSKSTETGTTKGTETGTSTRTEVSPEALAFINQIVPGLISSVQSKDYSKQAAITDSQGIVNQVMQNYKEMVLPQIFAGEASHGGYSSTSKALLSNDAASRAAGQAASLVADTVTKYGGIQGQNTNVLANLLNTVVNANKTSTTTTALDRLSTNNLDRLTNTSLDRSATNTLNRTANTTLNRAGDTSLNRLTNTAGLLDNPTFKALGGAAGIYSLLAKVLPPNALATAFNSIKNLFPSSGPGLDSLIGLTETNYDIPSLTSLAGLTEPNYNIPVEDIIGGLGTT